MLSLFSDPMFTESKVAQMSAFFIKKEGGRMPHLKLIKLLYLSDRESMNQWDFPISYDSMSSLNFGPILSNTLNYINGQKRNSENWDKWISDKSNHEVALSTNFNDVEDLDELSEIETDVMSEVWDTFGKYDQWELCEITHKNCPEWQDPKGSAIPIQYSDVFKALGRSDQDASDLQRDIEATKNQGSLFASL